MMRLNLSLLLCLLVALTATQNGVQAKTLVRGSVAQQQQPQETVVRLLKKSKDEEEVPEGVLEAAEEAPEDEDDEDDEEVEDEKEDKNAPEDDDEDEEEAIDTPIEGGVEADETTLGPDEEGAVTTAPVEGETDSVIETMAPTEAGPETITLTPFTLYVEGGEITEDELNLEAYLEAALGATDVELMLVTPEEEEVVNSTRFLRLETRLLQESVFYYEGTATFEGAAPDDVHDQVTAALSDSDALTAHVNLPNITITASPNTNPDGSVAVVAGAESEASDLSDSSDDGLTTTGLAIVIVAASIGGISLLIIVLVGATGPSGSTAQLK